MKVRGRRRSSNVNDIRGKRGRIPGGGLGGGAVLLLMLVVYLFTGELPGGLMEGNQRAAQPPAQQQVQVEGEDALFEFASVALADTEDAWTEIFAREGASYQPPQMTVYSDYVHSACGGQSAQVGPFYCPGDQTVYLDLSFYNDLHQRLGARGDFAFSYVISHEVGHHVQRETGIMGQVQRIQQQVSKERANEWNVALELQADYLAGVVARYQDEMGVLDEGDIEEAISATIAVGDDTIQKRAQGYVVPDSFTHGTAQQRMEWYQRGYEAGDLSQWDTYTALGLQ
ncbi:MAG: neutral zinc metallopeptidase [Tissierellia bacterium]|nr:neutral zinc metallopeptidase [Tissierellia bacterium]